MSRWWRAYDEAVDDPKLCLLTDKQHRAWFNLCCITSQNGGRLPSLAAIAFKLRTTPDKARSIVAELTALGLIDLDDETGTSAPHNWSRRQFQSDTSTERVKRFRKQVGNVSETVSETPSETEQIQKTDTEKINTFRTKKVRTAYSQEFELQFWKPYPRTALMSKAETFKIWENLADLDQISAIAAIPKYRAFLASKPEHKIVHACRFLSQRRFEGFAESLEPATTGPPQPPDPSLPSDEDLRKKYQGNGNELSGTSGGVRDESAELHKKNEGSKPTFFGADNQNGNARMASVGHVLSGSSAIPAGHHVDDRGGEIRADDGADPMARVV